MSGNDFYANEKSHEVSAGKLHIDVLGQPYSVQLEYAELLDLIGCFATPIPIHLAMPTRATSFRQLLRDAYAELLQAIEHAVESVRAAESLGILGQVALSSNDLTSARTSTSASAAAARPRPSTPITWVARALGRPLDLSFV